MDRTDEKQPSRLVFDASTQVSPFSAVKSPEFQPPDGKERLVERQSPGFSLSSISPSVNRRYSRSLDQALSTLQHSEGVREARTLLPGIDLRSTLGIESPSSGDFKAGTERSQSDDAPLQVIQAPRGIDLREAVLQALSLSREVTLGASAGLPSSPFSDTITMDDAQRFTNGENTSLQNDAWRRLVSHIGKGEGMGESSNKHAETSMLSQIPAPTSSQSHLQLQITIPQLDESFLGDGPNNRTLPTVASLAPSPEQSPEEKATCACRLWPILAPFTPRMLRDGILSVENVSSESSISSVRYGNDVAKPVARRFLAAVAIADVSGFTALTELLSKQGPDGVELLTRCMNSYFAQVIDLVLNYGGDISKFAGDAMLIVFQPTQQEIENDGQCTDGLGPATRRAARCMKELVEKFGIMGMTSAQGDVSSVPRDEDAGAVEQGFVRKQSSDRLRVWGVDGVMKKVGSGRRMLMQLGEELQKFRIADDSGVDRVTRILPRRPFRRSSLKGVSGLGSRRLNSTGRLNMLEELPNSDFSTAKVGEEDEISDYSSQKSGQSKNSEAGNFQQRFLASLTEEFESGRRSLRPPELPGASAPHGPSLSRGHAKYASSSPDLLAMEKRRLSSMTESERSSQFSRPASFPGPPPSLEPSHSKKPLGKPPAFKASDALLSLKVTLGTGAVCAFRVGGICESTVLGVRDAPRWEFFIADDKGDDEGPIAQLAAIEQYAIPGKVVLSGRVNALLEGFTTVCGGQGCFVLRSMDDNECPNEFAAASERENKNSSVQRHHQEMSHLAVLSPLQKVAAYQALRSHVPLNIRTRVEAGHLDFVNEVRICTIVFFGFPFLNDKNNGGLDAVQRVATVVQGRMVQDDGFFLQMRCDEKGYLALCAFGLPGRAHEDSPARGLRAAVGVLNTLQGGLAGVTTGDCFCAVVGSQARAEYTVFGDAINLAARLMSRASRLSHSQTSKTAVWCDEPTRWLVAGRGDEFVFHSFGAMQVKGKSGGTRAFSVEKKTVMLAGKEIANEKKMNFGISKVSEYSKRNDDDMESDNKDDEDTTSGVGFVGREQELSEFASRIKALVDGAGGSTVLVVGEAGVGKTRLVEEVAAGEGLGALRTRCTVVSGVGRSMRQSEPLFPWRRVYRRLFNIDREHSMGYENTREGSGDRGSGPTPLEARLRGRVPEYSAWRATLAGALGLSPDDMPVSWNYEESVIQPFLNPSNRNIILPDNNYSANKSGRSRYGGPLIDMPRARSLAVGHLQLRNTLLDIDSEVSPPSSLVSRSLSARTLAPEADEVSGQNNKFRISSSGFTHNGHSGHSYGSEYHHHHHHPPLAEMSVSLRAEKVRTLLVTLICEFMAVYGPLIIVMDDTHLFDGASWRLLLAIMDSCVQDGLLIVATVRDQRMHTTISSYAQYYQRVMKHSTTLQIRLERFTLDETRLFVYNALDGVPVPDITVRLLWEKSAGLAGYLHQMMLFLRLMASSPHSSQEATTMELAHLGMEFVRATVNVHAIVAARMDRLPPEEQLTLKVASIMGMVVYADLLLAIHPLSPSKPRLEASLQALSQGETQFLTRNWEGSDASGNTGTWRFEDVLARDVVYNMIPLSQRSLWHSKLAHALEAYRDDKGNNIPPVIIAYHWSQAAATSSGDLDTGDPGNRRTDASLKAVGAWEKAALEASLSWSYEGEIALLNHARASAEGAGHAIPHWRKASWERCTAAALFYTEMEMDGEGKVRGSDMVHPACVHCLRALDLLDVPMPWSMTYKNSAKYGPLTRHFGRKIGAVIKHLWARRKDEKDDLEMSFAPDLTRLARPNITGENDGSRQKELLEREIEAAVTVLTTALLVKGKNVADSEQNCRYVLWVCDNTMASSNSIKTVRGWIKRALNRAKRSTGLASAAAVDLEKLKEEVGGNAGGVTST